MAVVSLENTFLRSFLPFSFALNDSPTDSNILTSYGAFAGEDLGDEGLG